MGRMVDFGPTENRAWARLEMGVAQRRLCDAGSVGVGAAQPRLDYRSDGFPIPGKLRFPRRISSSSFATASAY